MYFYVERESALHRAHPLTKTAALVTMFVAALMVSHPLLVCLPLLAVLVGVLVSGSARNTLKVLPFIVILILFSVYIWTFLYYKDAGDTFIRVGRWYIPERSFLFGLGMGVRITVMLLAGVVFLGSTRVEDFTGGLHKAGLPYGVCFGMSLSFRLLPSFLEVVSTVREAQKSRGLDLDSGGVISKTRKHLPLLVPVFVSSIRRSDDMALALMSRGFGRSNERTYLRTYDFGFRDIALIAAMTALLVLLYHLR